MLVKVWFLQDWILLELCIWLFVIKYSKFTDNIGSGNITDIFCENTNKFQTSGGLLPSCLALPCFHVSFLYTVRSLIDISPRQLILQNISTQDILIPHPPLIKFQKKFQPRHLQICSSKQTSSILPLNFFLNRFSTDFWYKFCSNFLWILRISKYKTCK